MALYKNYSATALIGGGEDALDRPELDGDTLVDGDIAITFEPTATFVHRLHATSGAAESYPDVIAPDLHPGTKRWLKIASFDDYTKYVCIDGSTPFTSTVSGVTPTLSPHLSTKGYVDTQISTLSGSIVLVHSSLSGLAADDHTQYIRVDGTRAFSATVSGVTPTLSAHLATKGYVDSITPSQAATEGNATVPSGSTSLSVTISGVTSANYILNYGLKNIVDSEPAQYGMVTTSTTSSGFTVAFSDPIDSGNYILSWRATDTGGGGAGGASAFTDLTDAPSSYTGEEGKYVRVNSTADGLEFATVSGGTTTSGANLIYGATPVAPGQYELNYEGETKSFYVSDEYADVGDVLYMTSTGTLDRSNATDNTKMPVRAMSIVYNYEDQYVLLKGQVACNYWNWSTIGGNIYAAANNGQITQTVPSGSGNVIQIVGYALSATAMYFNPEMSVIVLA
jgi:hypothetical protein